VSTGAAADGPRFGPLYRRSVAEPLATQLIENLHPRPGMRVVTLLDTGDLVGGLLRARGARAVGWDGRSAPPPGDACVSLLSLGFAAPGTVLAAIGRALPPDGASLHLVLSRRTPPFVEMVFERALRRAGHRSGYLHRLVSEHSVDAALSAGYEAALITDVARFDSTAQVWRALVEEGPLGAEASAGGVAAPAMASVRDEVVAELARRAAADGTLLLPITAALLRSPLLSL